MLLGSCCSYLRMLHESTRIDGTFGRRSSLCLTVVQTTRVCYRGHKSISRQCLQCLQICYSEQDGEVECACKTVVCAPGQNKVTSCTHEASTDKTQCCKKKNKNTETETETETDKKKKKGKSIFLRRRGG